MVKAVVREQAWTLPNMITLLRMGSVPILVVMLYLEGMFWSWVAAGVFFVAGLTDLLDGWLARRLKKVSLLGQYLDPVADKLLVGSMLIMLVGMGRAPAWAAIIVICREIAVTGMRAVAASRGFMVPSDLLGKFKTAVQMLATLLLIFHYPLAGFDSHQWGLWALWVALFITLGSGVGYFVRFIKRLNQVDEAPEA